MSYLFHPGLLASVLIAQLASPSYLKREQAMQTLNQMAPLILPYLQSAGKHSDLELAHRSNQVLASYYEQAAAHFIKKARPSQWPCFPWIDMLPKDHPNRSNLIEYFLSVARDRVGRKGPPNWDDYRMATELYIHYLLQNQHTLEQTVELLDRMASQEEKWIVENGKNYSPPLKVPIASGK